MKILRLDGKAEEASRRGHLRTVIDQPGPNYDLDEYHGQESGDTVVCKQYGNETPVEIPDDFSTHGR